MKRALVLALMVVLSLGLAAFAGPYFEIEQNPLDPIASMTVGWDFDVAAVEYWPLRAVTGDFYFVNNNLWAYQTPWICGFDFGLEWLNPTSTAVTFNFNLGMDVEVTPVPWPDYLELDTWTTTFLFTGYPSDVFTIWVEAGFTYEVVKLGNNNYIGTWQFTPLIGFSCHW